MCFYVIIQSAPFDKGTGGLVDLSLDGWLKRWPFFVYGLIFFLNPDTIIAPITQDKVATGVIAILGNVYTWWFLGWVFEKVKEENYVHIYHHYEWADPSPFQKGWRGWSYRRLVRSRRRTLGGFSKIHHTVENGNHWSVRFLQRWGYAAIAVLSIIPEVIPSRSTMLAFCQMRNCSRIGLPIVLAGDALKAYLLVDFYRRYNISWSGLFHLISAHLPR